MDNLGVSGETSDLNFRSAPAIPDDSSRIFSRVGTEGSRPLAPPVPPRMYAPQANTGYGAFGGNGYGGGSGYGMRNFGYGGFGMGGGWGGGMYGRGMMYGSSGYGGYGGIGNPMGGGDVENRFIQVAEENSRSAFQSIESLVNTVLNVAAMLESTYFALTSSFRAVLGVAANFGRLRGLFAQVWHSFALLRGLNWFIKKVLYTLRISKIDPGSQIMAEAYAAAQGGQIPPEKNTSSMAVLAFLAFITAAPYLLLKLIGSVSNTALEETRDPKNWVEPVNAISQYDFVASNSMELSMRAGQNVVVAPRFVQSTHKLLDSGWVLATIDGQKSGLIPVNYIESVKQMRTQEQDKDLEVSLVTQA